MKNIVYHGLPCTQPMLVLHHLSKLGISTVYQVRTYIVTHRSKYQLSLLLVLLSLGEHRRIPNVFISNNNQATQLNPSVIPAPDNALQQFQDCGGEVTVFNPFGKDPLELRSNLIAEREELFYQQYSTFDEIFHSAVNENDLLIKNGLLDFITISKQLVTLL